MRFTVRLQPILLIVAAILPSAQAAEPVAHWKSLHGALYFIHGGSLADRQPPGTKDSKLSIMVDGKPAKEIFSGIGPDLPTSCVDEKGDRARSKKGVACSYTAQDKATKEGPYRCWIGIDLGTGESVKTVSC